jgi:hypothetical protein
MQLGKGGTLVQPQAQAADRIASLVMWFWKKWGEALLLLGGILVVIWVVIQGGLLLLLG